MDPFTDDVVQVVMQKQWDELTDAAKVEQIVRDSRLRRNDDVNQPEHYMICGEGGVKLCEVRDVQRHCSAGLTGIMASDMNNAIKYLLRSPFKGTMLKDLKKSRFMINELIKALED
jgi:hypothetical protein